MAMYNSYSGNSYYQNGRRSDDRPEFRIMEHIGVLGQNEKGWIKEVNVVAWNGNPPKIDIRDWQPDHARMSKGVNMQEIEAIRLATILSERYFGSAPGRPVMAENRPGQAEYQNGPPLMGGQPVHMMPHPADPAYYAAGQPRAEMPYAANGYAQANMSGGYAQPDAMGRYAQPGVSGGYTQPNAAGSYTQPNPSYGYAQPDAMGDYAQPGANNGYAHPNAAAGYAQPAATDDCAGSDEAEECLNADASDGFEQPGETDDDIPFDMSGEEPDPAA